MDPRPAEPRQRWRLVVAREAAARDLIHRDVVNRWEAGLLASGLPVSMSEAATPRPRISFAAPAPIGMLAERELIDVVLTELLLIHEVRATVEAAAPVGYRLVDLYDVWLSSPTLASLVTGGDYRATVVPETAEEASATTQAAGLERTVPMAAEVGVAIDALLAAPRIERTRTKGQVEVTIDIRPHLQLLRLAASAAEGVNDAGASFELWMRLRLGGEGGIGRPEEIVAALGERLDRRIVARAITRERIVLADDPDAGGGG